MGNILNSIGQLAQLRKIYNDKYFVDKSSILMKLNENINTSNCCICVTRPRRFGKTVMTNLINSYYAKGLPSKEIFDTLKISKAEDYEKHLNQHNVISLSMSEIPFECENYKDYIRFYNYKITKELQMTFPECQVTEENGPWQNLENVYNQTGETFIFVIDEWDSVFHSDFFEEKDGKKYLTFLKNLLKDKPYVELVYMTGVLPIKKYSSGSELNMFDEFYFPTDAIYDTYFGFTEEEVLELCKRNKKNGGTIQYNDLAEWYNGYYTAKGDKLYNPRSIHKALNQNTIKNYWTETGPGTEILELVNNNVDAVKEDILKMVSGEKVEFPLRYFKTEFAKLEKREEILSIMVVYGFLSYYDNALTIPNREIMVKFENVLSNQSMGYIAKLVEQSNAMLEATLSGNTKKMEEILEYVHDTEIPVLQYNDENSLSCVVNLIYLNARDKYRIEREEKTGRGFVDFIFYPLNPKDTAIILELKKDDTPEHAIEQIIKKKYDTKLCRLQNGVREYAGKVMAVGMAYSTKEKKHHCMVKEL